MSIFTRFTMRSLKKNRTRTIVSIVGVALSCALITAVLTSVVSLSNALLTRTGNDEGWWYAEIAEVTDDGFTRITNDPDIDQWTTVSELGTVELGAENGRNYGDYLYIKTWPGKQDAERPLLSLPDIEAGRAPEKPGEIILPHYLSGVALAPCGLTTTDGGPIQLGSTVQADLGTYTITNSDGTSYVSTSATGYYVDDEQTSSFEADLGSQTYTVVGFFRAVGYSTTYAFGNNSAYVYDDGTAAQRVITDDSAATWTSLLFNTHNPSTANDLANRAAEDGWCTIGSTAHSSLLRWNGITGDSQIWNTLYSIAVILAIVVMVAGISLVYNSFAISVAERTKQFGLLSSLGASRKQLRRTVRTEALVIGAIGIPVGVALGLAGCYVVFAITGEGLSAMFSINFNGMVTEASAVPVVVSPIAIATAIALALITLLISAWIPAIRAGRVSAVDAIRQTQDVKLSRRARRAARKAARLSAGTAVGDTKRSQGIAGKIFGIPGFIAHRNLSRSSSKGRVTVGALAVSVALLIISGSISDVMNYSSDTALDTMEGKDLVVNVDATSASENGTALVNQDGQVDQERMQESLARFYAAIQDIDNAAMGGYTTQNIAECIIPASMAADDMAQQASQDLGAQGYYGTIIVDYVDEATWDDYVQEQGLSADEFCDRDHPRAIAINNYDSYKSSTYANYQPFATGGTIRSLEYVNLDGRYISWIQAGENGELEAVYFEYDNEGNETEVHLPLSEAVAQEGTIEVGALADEGPSCVSESDILHVILPAWAIDTSSTMAYGNALISVSTNGDAAAATAAQDAIEETAANFPELDCTYSNTAASKAQTRMMASTIQIFIYCFTVITGLIAVANVFNTLTNSLMLRRREFAVLKSIGMGNHAFRRMIAYECASYALRGFAIGLALAALASYGLYLSMSLSYSTYEFSLPWMQVGISAVVVLIVILASVIYAMRRSRSSSVVEALREDAI